MRVRFQAPPCPVLFSSDKQAVPRVEEECEQEIGYQDQVRKFIVRTNHHSLIWLLSFKCPLDQLAR